MATKIVKSGQDVMSIADALAYALAASTASSTLCSTAFSAYNAAYSKALALKAQNVSGTNLEAYYIPTLRGALVAADKICDVEKAKKGVIKPTVPPKLSVPPVVPADTSDSNMWFWLIGAAVVGVGGVIVYKKMYKKGKR